MYKIIDGVLYQTADVTVDEVKTLLLEVENKVKPYINGINTCKSEIKRLEDQIEIYKGNVAEIISQNRISEDIVKAVSPDKLSNLGF